MWQCVGQQAQELQQQGGVLQATRPQLEHTVNLQEGGGEETGCGVFGMCLVCFGL